MYSNNFAAINTVRHFYLERFKKLPQKVSNTVISYILSEQDQYAVDIINFAYPGQGLIITNTAKHAITQFHKIYQSLGAGIFYFSLFGPSIIGKCNFCQSIIEQTRQGKSLHLSEILNLNNGTALLVIFFGSGEDCKHYWEPDPFYKPI